MPRRPPSRRTCSGGSPAGSSVGPKGAAGAQPVEPLGRFRRSTRRPAGARRAGWPRPLGGLGRAPQSSRTRSWPYLRGVRSGSRLVSEQRLAPTTVDTARQFRDERAGVLRDDQCVAIWKLPNLLWPQDWDVVAVEAAAPAAAVEVVAAARHPCRAKQVGYLLVELAVLAAAEDRDVVRQAEHRSRFVLAVADDELAPGLCGVDERQAERPLVGHPCP